MLGIIPCDCPYACGRFGAISERMACTISILMIIPDMDQDRYITALNFLCLSDQDFFHMRIDINWAQRKISTYTGSPEDILAVFEGVRWCERLWSRCCEVRVSLTRRADVCCCGGERLLIRRRKTALSFYTSGADFGIGGACSQQMQ